LHKIGQLTRAQWIKNECLISSEDFIEAINFFHHTSGTNIDANATSQCSQPNQVSISPTFYVELLRQIPFAKKLQTQIVSN
jgi:hypothetical protein